MVITAVRIDPDAYYDTIAVCKLLGFNEAVLSKARRTKALRFTKQGSRTLYRGNWIEAWLAGDVRPEMLESTGA